MNPVKSGPSYFRRALKIKGQTEHSGRGFFDLDYDCTAEELRQRIDALVAKFPDRFDVTREKTFISVELKTEFLSMGSYGSLYLTNAGSLTVGM